METTALRPMGIGDILDRAINLYRRNFITLMGIAAAVTVPVAALQVIGVLLAVPLDFLSPNLSPSRTTAALATAGYLGMFGVFFIAMIIAILASVFEAAAMVLAVSEALFGRALTIRDAYRRAFRRGWSLLGGMLILGLMNGLVLGLYLACAIVPLVTAAVGARTNPSLSAATSVAFVLLACVGIAPLFLALAFVNVRFLFVPQVIMLEKLGALDGLRRSWRLGKGSFWRVLLIAFLLYVFVLILSAVPSYAISFVGLLMPSVIIQAVLNATVSTVIGVVTTPLYLAVLTLLYYDLRIRHEGFDLELRAQEMLAPTEPTP
ncbi:MAG: glycerophosphoryl diester phosphodiesterase membrane domain-containing protein [Chloroflexi bacterium]|nr:glycerophosphoryl diester phosphodiesterase membrane domain-containing protein [Chloroflexota bacterium]